MKYQEKKQDLFQTTGYALGHCISQDAAMGAGIAKIFRSKYPNMPAHVKSKGANVGDVVTYPTSSGYIFNLITKKRYYHKPTYETFRQSIESLKDEVVRLNVKKLAVPLLGAGLDRLDWNKNKAIIQEVFHDVDVEILVCVWE